MTPARRGWLSFIANAKGDLEALSYAALCRLGEQQRMVLTRDEVRDVSSVVAMCEHAAVLCERVRLSLSNEATDEA